MVLEIENKEHFKQCTETYKRLDVQTIHLEKITICA